MYLTGIGCGVYVTLKRKKEKNRELLRKNKRTILFNDREIRAIEQYCEKYKITNRSKFMREVIIKTILEQLEDDYPKLFGDDNPILF